MQSFFTEVSCKGFGWVEGSGLGNIWRWWLGVHPSHGVRRASSKPSTAIRKVPMESEGLGLPPRAVGLPGLCSAQPRTGPAGGIATQEINTDRGQGIHPKYHFQGFASCLAAPSYKPSSHMSTLFQRWEQQMQHKPHQAPSSFPTARLFCDGFSASKLEMTL